jgi:hypothetical protein
MRVPREELRRQQRPFPLIAGLAGRDEVAQVMAAPARERDYVIQGGVLEPERGPAIDTTASTIPKSGSLDLPLVLLVQDEASVTG